MHPIAHAGLETDDTLPANVIRGCYFHTYLKSNERGFHIQMDSTLMQKSYFVAKSENVHPEMVNTFIID